MFEGVGDGELIEVMGEATREESTSIAQRLAAVAELYVRRRGALADRQWWCADDCDAVAAEVSAVQNISHARAVGQVQFACNLWHRLPRLARVFVSGVIDFRLVATVVNRTENVDDTIMPELDEAIAARCVKWMKLSGPKLKDRVDQWVARFDPAGVRVAPEVKDNRHLTIEPGVAGMADVRGRVTADAGAALDQALDALAASVCANDPRTHAQRRADAGWALARREAALACRCGLDDCPAPGEGVAVDAAVIHVLAEQATVEGRSDAPGYLPGFGILPAESVRELAAKAELDPVRIPVGPPDPGYRPSVITREFTQWRDLTCRWPGCDRPVAKCELDHTVPYPAGFTHASDLKHYCGIHHLIKTFHSGWGEQQLADGTIILTAPTGHTYISQAHGAALFPTLGQSTGELPVSTGEQPTHYRTLMMPRRKQTRAQDRRDRINAERRQRTQLIAEEEQQRQAWLATNYEPPPF
ncbi:HNH endonuclease [Mycobacterium sp. OAE908]|uniref:HNH endonuclease signature motif containing protein n=1 Tax=Mycobacterium sp. OAE908 TaxID=2817899 RepID=UPI001AE55D34